MRALCSAPMTESSLPKLAEMRVLTGLSQQQLANALGINARTILRWENGQYDPQLKDLRKIAAYFGVSVAYLIGESEDSGQQPPRQHV